MDEFYFHLSQRLETLQGHLVYLLQHSRQLGVTASDYVTVYGGRLWNTQWGDHVKYFSNRAVAMMQGAVRHCSTVLAQPSEVYYQLSELVRVEMPVIYPGGAGFITGAVIGVIIGLSWQRSLSPFGRMKAVVCMAYDGLEALSCIDDATLPIITKPYQLIVQVKSASVDVVDIKICYGYGRALRRYLGANNMNSKGDLPVTLGRDCAGIVVDIGSGVNKFEIGDEVWLVSPYWANGTIAEMVLANEDMVAKKPRGIGFEGAASLPYSGCLAYHACSKAGLLQPSLGKRVLIHSGVSPVGCVACQLARLNGCEVTVTCSTRAAAVARALGAKHVVTYGQIDMEAQLLQDRFDVVLNTVGGVSDESCLKLCKPDGVFVSTVLDSASYNDHNFPMSLVQGVQLRVKYMAKKLTGQSNKWNDVDFSGAVLENLGKLVDKGHIQPVVDKVFAPQDTTLALQHCDSADAIGKTVVRFRSSSEEIAHR